MSQNGQRNNWITSVLDFVLKIDTWKELVIILMIAWTTFFIWDFSLNNAYSTMTISGCLDKELSKEALDAAVERLEGLGITNYSIYSVDSVLRSRESVFDSPGLYQSFFLVYEEHGVQVIVLYNPED